MSEIEISKFRDLAEADTVYIIRDDNARERIVALEEGGASNEYLSLTGGVVTGKTQFKAELVLGSNDEPSDANLRITEEDYDSQSGFRIYSDKSLFIDHGENFYITFGTDGTIFFYQKVDNDNDILLGTIDGSSVKTSSISSKDIRSDYSSDTALSLAGPVNINSYKKPTTGTIVTSNDVAWFNEHQELHEILADLRHNHLNLIANNTDWTEDSGESAKAKIQNNVWYFILNKAITYTAPFSEFRTLGILPDGVRPPETVTVPVVFENNLTSYCNIFTDGRIVLKIYDNTNIGSVSTFAYGSLAYPIN